MIENKRIFVTGASGFIGRALVSHLIAERCGQVVCLSRTTEERTEYMQGTPVKWVKGDLLEPAGYQHHLSGSDLVFHLGASTGNSSADEHRQINFDGTKKLISATREAGVDRFIFVSTIAAGYEDIRDYPYAQSKRDAETVVKESGLDETIVRPTIVLGKGSGIGESLMKFAMLPLVPVFGNGHVMIQPIHVDDVARGLVELAADPETIGETVELGGKDALNWDEWFRRARQVAGGGTARLVHLPLWLFLPVLRGLERIAGGKLPVTAGQLSAFRHDSRIAGNAVLDRIRDKMRGVDAMIGDLIVPGDFESLPAGELEKECEVFARHLVARGVSAYLLRAYRSAHEEGGPLANHKGGFESRIVNFARRGGWRLSVADAYVRMFLPNGILRRKLVLVMALLENSSDGADQFNIDEDQSMFAAVFSMSGWGIRYVFLLVIGLAVLGPRHLFGGRS